MAQTTILASSSTSRATLADLLEQLGDIPPNRVRLRPAPGTATERDVIEVEARENRHCELVDGSLVEKAMGYIESYLAMLLGRVLLDHVDKYKLGIILGEGGMTRLAPGLVRIPDISFIAWERFPGRVLPRSPIVNVAPDLAVEVLSESNTEREMERKRREYFEAGVLEIWIVDPRARSLRVYKGSDTVEHFGEGDTFEGSTVLPGFQLSLREWFSRIEGDASAAEKEHPPSHS